MKQPHRIRFFIFDDSGSRREVSKAEHARWLTRKRAERDAALAAEKPTPTRTPTEAEILCAVEREVDRQSADIAKLKRFFAKPAPAPAPKYPGLTRERQEEIDCASGLAPTPAQGAHNVGVRQVLGPKPSSSSKLTAEQKREIDALSFGETNHGRVTQRGTRQVLGGFEPAVTK